MLPPMLFFHFLCLLCWNLSELPSSSSSSHLRILFLPSLLLIISRLVLPFLLFLLFLLKNIVVAVDGSAYGDAALAWALNNMYDEVSRGGAEDDVAPSHLFFSPFLSLSLSLSLLCNLHGVATSCALLHRCLQHLTSFLHFRVKNKIEMGEKNPIAEMKENPTCLLTSRLHFPT